jgi:hypothetical protein
LVPVDWILEQTRALALRRLDEVVKRQVVVLRGIGQCQEARSIDSCNTVDIDRLGVRIAKKPLKRRFELGVPVEDVGIHAVEGIQADIALWKPNGKPFRARIVVRAVNDMGNLVQSREALGQKGARADQNPSVEPGRRVF